MPAGRVAATSDTEQLLRAVIDASDDAILSLDASARVLSWNRSAERIFGYPAAEVVGRPAEVLFPEHLQAPMADVFGSVLAGDVVDHLETEIGRKDGMPVPISLSASPVAADGPDGAAAVVVARDVTEQRLAQATLAEVEERLQGWERLSRTGTWLWDRRTGVVQWSDEHHRIHGREPAQFEGTVEAHLACAHPDDRPGLQEAMEAAVAAGHPFAAEYRVPMADGGVRRVSTWGEPTIGSADTVVGLRGFSRLVDEDG